MFPLRHIKLQTWELKSNSDDEYFTLTFDTFDVYDYGYVDYDYDDFPDCGSDDYVYISGGSSSSPRPLNKMHCSNDYLDRGYLEPIPGPFSGTDMTVRFKSDNINTRPGFLAVVSGDATVTTDVTSTSE